MFEAGTKSAETPRTGASAPSLNSMGADPKFAGQPVVRRLRAGHEPVVDPNSAAAGDSGLSGDDSSFRRVPPDDGELFERIVDALEQRVLDELERRGRRHAPGVF
jgi:hypothetical protein